MEDRLTLSYFYGKEADQYSFYKIPKLLFTDEHFKKVSVEAKVLYKVLLFIPHFGNHYIHTMLMCHSSTVTIKHKFFHGMYFPIMIMHKEFS